MKITEECINHNAVRIIDNSGTTESLSEDGAEKAMRWSSYTLGYIDGVLDLAKALKEVLEE